MSCGFAMSKSIKRLWPFHELQRLLPGRVSFQADMREFTTLKVGGPADALVEPASPSEVERLIDWCMHNGVPWVVVGGGSNLVVRDGGIRGVVVRLGSAMGSFWVQDSGKVALVRVQAGCPLKRLLREAVRRGWKGMEFLAGIPGRLGGAVAMNAGTSQEGIGNLVQEVKWFDPDMGLVSRSREHLRFGYRSLSLPQRSILLEVTLALGLGKTTEVREQIRAQMRRRQASQPLGKPSAGSIFKNPPGDFAGRLIEQAGLKGLTRGGAVVSQKHANFILNKGGARAVDIVGLIKEIQEKVLEQSRVYLEPEVRIVGEDD